MDKKAKLYILIAIGTLSVLMLLQYNKPKDINWFESYVASHKIPYGTYVFNSLIPKLFTNKAQHITVPPFEFLSKNKSTKGTYLFVNNNISFGNEELETLLEWTAAGNTIFVASKNFDKKLLDTLHIEKGIIYGGFEVSQQELHQLVNPRFTSKDSIFFNRNTNTPYFYKLDTLRTIALAKVQTNHTNEVNEDTLHINLIRQRFGKGYILLSTFPEAFTNYFLLKNNNRTYTASLLSYIDDTYPIYLDNHHKSGKSYYTSPMYIFLNTKELKWAYYTALLGVLLYIVFEGKRKQRAIKIIPPLKNQTLAFTRTIADMYYEKSDQKSISEHKISYFLDTIKSTYFISITRFDTDFYKSIADKSGNSYDEVKTLFTFIKTLRNKSTISDSELLKLNSLIEKFKANGK